MHDVPIFVIKKFLEKEHGLGSWQHRTVRSGKITGLNQLPEEEK
jgi:hypothetical protein